VILSIVQVAVGPEQRASELAQPPGTAQSAGARRAVR
jgi:hypothetical protein